MLLGSINNVALTVSDLEAALPFFDGFLGFLGYRRGDVIDNPSSSSRLAIYLNAENGCAINIWAAAPGLKGHSHHIYAPGLHHLALNVALNVPLHQDMQSLWSQYDDDQISLVIDFLKKSCQAAERQVADLQSRARKKARTR